MRVLILLLVIFESSVFAQSVSLDHPSTIYDVAISKLGDKIASAGKDSVVNIYTVEGEFIGSFTEFNHSLSDVIFTDSDSKVVAVDYMGFRYVLDLNTGSIESLKIHNQSILDLYEINTMKMFVTSGRDQVAKIWTAQWELVAELEGHKGQVRKASYIGDRLLTVADDSSIKIWDLSGQLIRTIDTPHESAIWELAIDLEGNMVTGDRGGIVVVWDQDFEVVSKWKAHEGAISGMVLLEEYMLTCADDGHINIWSLGGKSIKNIAAHEKYCTGISLSSDQSTLVSGGGDGKVKIWSMNQLLN
ncbi:WD40 repeat domain-containing protein [Reichenbachiella sp.]|uniref:WD40 repeat domain-containing protein n=1 Tax=Reichenbachiella sp. TaxID=2184521 RepID=UPI003BAF244F